MASTAVTGKTTVGNTAYEIVQSVNEGNLLIVRTPGGRLELWEQVAHYDGETMDFHGRSYRFLRSWKGAGHGRP